MSPAPVVDAVSLSIADLEKASAHVLRPAHLRGIVSNQNVQDAVLPRFDFTGAADGLYLLDVDAFGSALHAALQLQVAGYVVRLRQHGATIYTREWTWAKTPVDGAQAWSTGVKMHVASCSKFVTAVAMTRVLRDKGVSPDTPIIGFLPAYWAKGPNVGMITFRHLMTHRSGFSTGLSDSDFEFMKVQVSAGVASVGSFDYQNINFGLCRILLSTLLGAISPQAIFTLPLVPNSNDLVWDYLSIDTYRQYVQDHLFAPAGVAGATFAHPPEAALAYPFPAGGNGWNSDDLTTMSGGVGWHLSVDDLLAFLGALRRGGSILGADTLQAMLDDGFGIEIDGTVPTPLGTLYWKGGYWGNPDSKIEQSLLYLLPRDMELAAFANSPIGSPGQSFPGIVLSAYLSAIRSTRSLRDYFLRKRLPVSSPVHSVVGPARSVRQMLLA